MTTPETSTTPTSPDPTDPRVTARQFADEMWATAEDVSGLLRVLAARFASGTRRNAVVPAELDGIPKAALRKIADVLDLYADEMDTIRGRADVPPTCAGSAGPAAAIPAPRQSPEAAVAYLADPDPGAAYQPEAPAETVTLAVVDPMLIGQPWPATADGDDEQAAPAAEAIGLPFSTRRTAPASEALLNPGPLSWPDHDSPSSIAKFAECGFRYLAEYGHGLRDIGAPAWWSVGGTAAHRVIEAWERVRARGEGSPSADDAAKIFTETFGQQIEQTREASAVPVEDWIAARQGAEGRAYWEDNGPNWVAGYVLAQAGRTFEPLVEPDGELCLEIEGTVLCGPTERRFEVRMDALMYDAVAQAVRVRDYKFGRTPASGGIQLPAYRYAAAHLGLAGDVVNPGLPGGGWTGEYWLGRKAAASPTIPLPYEQAMHRVVSAVTTLERARTAGVFMPNPTSFCSACPIKPICPAHTADGKSVIDNG